MMLLSKLAHKFPADWVAPIEAWLLTRLFTTAVRRSDNQLLGRENEAREWFRFSGNWTWDVFGSEHLLEDDELIRAIAD
jgi:hypothetical protein